MKSRSVLVKTGLAAILVAGSVAPVMASGTDEMKLRVIGAPATESQLYIGKKFNFSADELKPEHRFTGDGFNYAPDRDTKLVVQPAK